MKSNRYDFVAMAVLVYITHSMDENGIPALARAAIYFCIVVFLTMYAYALWSKT